MRERLETDQLQTFAAVAETGSFTRAAERVGRSQSAVSTQIRQLEETLGRRLFERGARGVRLTGHGERLASRARDILTMMAEAVSHVRGDAVAGPVRIGIPEEYGAAFLPRVLAHFARDHPQAEVTVDCSASDVLAARLDDGALDLAVVIIDAGNPEGETLVVDPTVWATSADGAPHLDEPLPLAMYEQDCWWRDWALRALERQGRAYRIAYTCRSTAGIQAAVASGLAIAVLGRSMLPHGARILDAATGFVELPSSRVVLRTAASAAGPAVAGMAEALRESFRRQA